MEVMLQPLTNFRVRYFVFALMLIPIFIAPLIAWWVRLLVCVLPLALIGTYRVSAIDGDKFRTQLFIGFMPQKAEKCNLPGVTFIETKYNSAGFSGEANVLLQPMRVFLRTCHEIMIPAFGGAYEIWLVTAKGREIIAWQGFEERHFEENLALLKSLSGAEVRGRSK